MWSGNGTGPGCYHGRDLLVPALCFKCNKIWLRKVSWTLIEKTQCPFGKVLVLIFLHGNKRDFFQICKSVLKGLPTVHWRFRGKWSPLEQKGRGVCVYVCVQDFIFLRQKPRNKVLVCAASEISAGRHDATCKVCTRQDQRRRSAWLLSRAQLELAFALWPAAFM